MERTWGARRAYFVRLAEWVNRALDDDAVEEVLGTVVDEGIALLGKPLPATAAESCWREFAADVTRLASKLIAHPATIQMTLRRRDLAFPPRTRQSPIGSVRRAAHPCARMLSPFPVLLHPGTSAVAISRDAECVTMPAQRIQTVVLDPTSVKTFLCSLSGVRQTSPATPFVISKSKKSLIDIRMSRSRAGAAC